MATFSDVMRWRAELDTTDVEEGFDRIKRDGEDALEDVGDAGDGLETRFSGIGGKMGKAMVAGFAAAGVGALLLQEVDKAFAREDALNIVAGRFRLTEQEAREYGEVAGRLYAEGWGDSLEGVTQSVATTARKVGETSEAELTDITRKALAISKTFGVDSEDIMRSATQLIENDLVPDATAALDLITGAFQEGGDEAGDLLDTIDEYSQHWSDMGLSGEDALNQIITGLQNGQRDADKVADAVKQMGIQVIEETDAISEAYSDLGLDADEMRDKFLEGGPAAREAFTEVIDALKSVEDPVEQNRLAVELIGTQYEDLGSKALDTLGSIDGALEDTTGRAQELADTVEATPWAQLQRRGEAALGGIGDYIATQVLPGLEAIDEIIRGVDDIINGRNPLDPGPGVSATGARPISDEELARIGVDTYASGRSAGRAIPAPEAAEGTVSRRVVGGDSPNVNVTINGFANEDSIRQLTTAIDEVDRRRGNLR